MGRKKELEPNPPRGQRGDFLQITVMLPADLWGALRDLGVSRRVAGHKEHTVSALVREAVVDLLNKARD